ncbi:MAG: protein translocase subunit SecF [Alphaproteobacteria bacterium]|nr:protein translocase subunit SecF [Alphaproteobacteria bacterium]
MLNFISRETNIDFVGKRFVAFVFSAVLLIGALGLLTTKGLSFGIDFTGGTLIEVRVSEQAPDLGSLRQSLNSLELGAISIQEFGAPDDLLIRLPEQEGGAQGQKVAVEKIRATLDQKFETVDYRRVEFVGPQVGEELKKKGLYAVLFSMFGMLVYIWFRFEWQFSVAAIVALLHDSILTVGLFALMQWEFNLSTVAAVLMIAGYSINDTVVVFDRIRENLRKFKKMPVFELLNKSINQTLSRTLMTSITTLLALLALWGFGGEVIRGFVNALIFGILIGTYSSIFVAAPLLTFLNIRTGKVLTTEETA